MLVEARRAAGTNETSERVTWLNSQSVYLVRVLVIRSKPRHGMPFIEGAKQVFWETSFSEGSPEAAKM